MAKVIRFTLDPNSIERAAREVNRFAMQVQYIVDELVRRLTDEGVNVAIAHIYAMDAYDTGDLVDSISGYYNDETHTGFVFAGSFHAIYVEYGTGIVGKSNDEHPEIQGEWKPPPSQYTEHDTNHHGEAGWWYKAPFGWYMPADGSGVRLAWTKGMRARPFMYETQKRLEQMSVDIYNQLFSNIT